MGLNLCIGYTGLVSFGHSTWFGIGAYAAGLIQLHWFRGEIWLPLLLSMAMVTVLSAIAGTDPARTAGAVEPRPAAGWKKTSRAGKSMVAVKPPNRQAWRCDPWRSGLDRRCPDAQ
jgi:hypothetical protein